MPTVNHFPTRRHIGLKNLTHPQSSQFTCLSILRITIIAFNNKMITHIDVRKLILLENKS